MAGELRVVDLQTDLIGLDVTRLVAPLREAAGARELPGLTPAGEVEGARHLVRILEMAAVPRSALGPVGGSLIAHRDALLRAIDVLTHGF